MGLPPQECFPLWTNLVDLLGLLYSAYWEQLNLTAVDAYISNDYINCKINNIWRENGTANLRTGLVERTIQPWENLKKPTFRKNTGLRENFSKSLYVLRFTTHSELETTLFELHSGRKPNTRLANLPNSVSVDCKDLSVFKTRSSDGQITDHLVLSKKRTDNKFKRACSAILLHLAQFFPFVLTFMLLWPFRCAAPHKIFSLEFLWFIIWFLACFLFFDMSYFFSLPPKQTDFVDFICVRVLHLCLLRCA